MVPRLIDQVSYLFEVLLPQFQDFGFVYREGYALNSLNTLVRPQIELTPPLFLEQLPLKMREVNLYWGYSSGEYALM